MSIALSPAMRAALRAAILEGDLSNVKESTRFALLRRHICDENWRFTEVGRVLAVGLLGLREQCALLSIPHECIDLRWSGRSEEAALLSLSEVCQWGFADEGRTLQALIHGLVLPRLYRIATRAWRDADRARSYLYSSYAGYIFLIECEPEVTEFMLDDILRLGSDDFGTAWNLLRAWNSPPSSHPAASVDAATACGLLDDVGRPFLYEVATRTFQNPYAFWAGWPDLMVYRSTQRLCFYEVKTKDKLHLSQIVTLTAMRDFAGMDVGVLQLRQLDGRS
jgi:hypothetical protein